MLILAIIVVDYYKLLIPRQQRREIHQKLIIPPEFMNGDTLYVGDSLEKITKFIEIEQIWYPGIFQGKSYAEGCYRGNRGFNTLIFNYKNKLSSLSLVIENKDSIPMKQFFIKTAKTFIKYYGNNYKLYHNTGFKSCRMLLWRLSEDNTLLLEGNIDSKNMSIADSNNIVIWYNYGLAEEYSKLSTNAERKDLGLE